MRLVVDTNVLVRALLSPGPAREFVKNAALRHLLLYHAEQLTELRDVAARPRLNLLPSAVEELIERVVTYGTSVECPLDSIADCRDPKDNYILAIAEAGQADFIISYGSHDLTALAPCATAL